MNTIYVDMDGVLARWNEKASEEETHEKGYFLNREAENAAIGLVRKLVNNGFDVRILSSVYLDEHSKAEKREWLDIHGLNDIPAIFVPYGENKDEHIAVEGIPVLIDDYSKNLKSWEKKGFTAIKFMNGINNRPKLVMEENTINMYLDSWSGYSIDNRMTSDQMYKVVAALAA